MRGTVDHSVNMILSSAGRFALCLGLLIFCLPLRLHAAAEVSGSASLPAGLVHAGQPVGGFSAIVSNGDGSFDAVTGSDAGSAAHPADIHIRVYTLRPNFTVPDTSNGKIEIVRFFELSDPKHFIPFAIAESFLPQRILTAADFDIQAMQRAPDGTLWFGDSLGPFLLHTDREGRLLEAPIEFEVSGAKLRTPRNPNLEENAAVRVMNAFRREADLHGHTKQLIVSPDFNLLRDGDLKTGVGNRINPENSGMKRASSEIFDVEELHRAGFAVVPYTVNEPPDMTRLMQLKVDGIISDDPAALRDAVEKFDANGDGKPGDLLTAEGLIDAKFSAQGHRGGRDLRPENTLPAMEAGLDSLVNTLETDCAITADNVVVLSHDAFLNAKKWARSDGQPYAEGNEALIKDYKCADLRTIFRGDCLLPDHKRQTKDPARSPVSVAFCKENKLPLYSISTLDDLFKFVAFYAEFYRTGAGRNSADAVRRAKNAQRVRFNIETKINPRHDTDATMFNGRALAFCDRTIAAKPFAKLVADVIMKNQLEERTDIQSFDFETLRYVHAHYPAIRTVFLFGDFPLFCDPHMQDSDDGTNLQGEGGANSPWLGGIALAIPRLPH